MAVGSGYVRRCRLMALGFWLLFLAYSSAQLLQTSLNKGDGFKCLSTLYAIFGAAALLAPHAVSILGPRALLSLSAAPYVVMVAANIDPNPAFLLPACAAVGWGAATLWSAQGTYVGRLAVLHAAKTGMPLTNATSQLNAAFFVIFVSSGGTSALMAAVIMMSTTDAARPLFLLLTGVGIAGVALLACMPAPDAPEGVLLDTAWLAAAWRTVRARLGLGRSAFAGGKPQKDAPASAAGALAAADGLAGPEHARGERLHASAVSVHATDMNLSDHDPESPRAAGGADGSGKVISTPAGWDEMPPPHAAAAAAPPVVRAQVPSLPYMLRTAMPQHWPPWAGAEQCSGLGGEDGTPWWSPWSCSWRSLA
jgi:hypothetical protein